MKLEITRRAELAVRALALLNRTGQRFGAEALADALGTTVGFVPQVVGPLVKAGWVQAGTGPSGGYASLVELNGVTMMDVIEAVDGATSINRCVIADHGCRPVVPCLMHSVWREARSELVRALSATAMSSVDPFPRDSVPA